MVQGSSFNKPFVSLGEACFLASGVPQDIVFRGELSDSLLHQGRSKYCVFIVMILEGAFMWRTEDNFVFHQTVATSFVTWSLVA